MILENKSDFRGAMFSDYQIVNGVETNRGWRKFEDPTQKLLAYIIKEIRDE